MDLPKKSEGIEHMEVEVQEGWISQETLPRLYYISRGTGLPIVFCNGIGVSAASFWPSVCRELARGAQTICWDYAGHGRSDSPPDLSSLTIEACARDLARVMDHLDIPKAIVAGHSMGSQVAFEFYRLFPERVLALIPTLGTFQRPFDNFMRFSYSADIFDKVSQVVLENSDIARRVWPHLFYSFMARPFARLVGLIHPTLLPKPELDLYLSHLQVISPDAFFALARDMQSHSASDLLELIEVPTLILAGEKDLFTPIEASYEMHRRIPGSELFVVREGSHAALAEQPELFWLRIERFLLTHFPSHISVSNGS